MRTADLKKTVLTLGDREFYGYEIHKRLASEGHEIEIGRLYRVLNEMLKDGLLQSRWEKSKHGPRKKVYRVSKTGLKELDGMLAEAIKIVHKFYGQYLMNLPTELNPVTTVANTLASSLPRSGNVAYVISKSSGIHERIIHAIQIAAPAVSIYFVKPASITIKMEVKGILSLNGGYDNIPMKDGYFDLVTAIGLPSSEELDAMVRECSRVCSQSGKLAIITPSVLVQDYRDPLTIGDFVEKHEHASLNGAQESVKEVLLQLLRRNFSEAKEEKILHLTLFHAARRHSESTGEATMSRY